MRYLLGFLAVLLFCTPLSATQQSVTGIGLMVPFYEACFTNTNKTNSVLDAAGDDVAFVFLATKTGTISKLGFRTSTVTTGDTVDVRLETVSTTNGFPSGTLCGTNTNASQVIAAADDNVWFTTTLTSGCSVTAETAYAIVIEAPAGWGTGNMQIYVESNGGSSLLTALPYRALDTGVGYTITGCSQCGFYFEYSDGSTGEAIGSGPYSTVAATAYNNGSAIDERANIFKLPFPVKIKGAWAMFAKPAGADFSLFLYDADGTTTLESVVLDGDIGGTGNNLRTFQFTNEITLAANTTYRIALRPDTATSLTLSQLTVNAASYMDAFGLGQNLYTSTRVNAGAWTDTTTTRECLGIIISGANDGFNAHPFVGGM